ncbi:MAG: hypothetical protein IBJ12_08290 [Sphingomonadaceae bacterium]|nr:hypothetical protein [Sphingomonadaceae bacterium]
MMVAEYWSAFGRKLAAWQHGRVVRQILNTPPIIPADDGVILFSMIGTAVLLPYLVAMKSLHAQLQRGRVMLLDDGTLTKADKLVLADHVGDPVILTLSDVQTAPCPKGNCWERLLAILDLRRDHYVIQLDSDTVTLGCVPEVAAAIDANRSFTLGGGVEDVKHGFMTVPDMIRRIYPDGPLYSHIQSVIESGLRDVPGAGELRYIRGCAGFAGFSRSTEGRALAERFAVDAGRAVGPRFNEWGSEQAASNFVVANDPDPIQLPYDRYTNHWEEALPPDPAFIHYIGTYRYDRGSYLASTQRAITQLGKA